MAYAGHYRNVFSIPVARRKRGVPSVFRDRELMDMEFSEYGRAARFTPGWYILPAVVTGMAIIAAVLVIV